MILERETKRIFVSYVHGYENIMHTILFQQGTNYNLKFDEIILVLKKIIIYGLKEYNE